MGSERSGDKPRRVSKRRRGSAGAAGGAARRRAARSGRGSRARKRRVWVVWAGLVVLGCVVALGSWVWLALRAVHKAEDRWFDALARIPALTQAESAVLRRFLNPAHLAIADRWGVGALPDRAAIERLVGEGRLVALADSELLEVAPMTHGAPAVTAVTRDTIELVATGFQRRVRAAGAPAHRVRVTSATRSEADQKALAKSNRNAATRSSHSHGVSVDLHSERFGAPTRAEVLRFVPARFVPVLRTIGVPAGRTPPPRALEGLKATLGRVLIELQDEERLLAILERQQPVFHVTRGPGTAHGAR